MDTEDKSQNALMNLFKIRKTVFQMLKDRGNDNKLGYLVGSVELNLTFDEFK